MSDPLGPDPNRGPTGEAEIIDAVIASAAKLFAENEPGSVPLRTIAREAGVNYGLLHRHFGTKVDLVQATVRRYSDAFEPSNDAKNDPVQLIAEMASYYLNNASIGCTPNAVMDARDDYLRLCESNPWLYMWGGEWDEAKERIPKPRTRDTSSQARRAPMWVMEQTRTSSRSSSSRP